MENLYKNYNRHNTVAENTPWFCGCWGCFFFVHDIKKNLSEIAKREEAIYVPYCTVGVEKVLPPGFKNRILFSLPSESSQTLLVNTTTRLQRESKGRANVTTMSSRVQRKAPRTPDVMSKSAKSEQSSPRRENLSENIPCPSNYAGREDCASCYKVLQEGSLEIQD